MRRTKDGLIPTLRLTLLIDKPDPNGMTAAAFGWWAETAPARVTLTTDDGIVMGSGVIVGVMPEEDGR